MRLTLENPSAVRRLGRYFELADPSLLMPAMPLRFAVAAHGRETLEFDLKPTARGMKSFPAAQVLLRSSLGLLDWNLRIGTSQSRRVFPNFKRQTVLIGRSKGRLAGRRPVTPSFQSAHDDCVMFLLDCGRRMVAGDTQSGFVAGDFDRSLEALMQLARLALSIGDAVGALTFGTQPGAQTRFTPRKGPQAFGALMAELGDAEPSPVFSDYTAAAAALVRCRRKHSLVVVITVCRDEDDGELTAALRLLCARHRVILASLKEQILAGLAAQPLARRESVLEVAAAQDYHQRRAELLARLAAAGALLIDCEPRMLGVELVNRYASLKRTGTI